MDQYRLQYLWGQLSVQSDMGMERHVISISDAGDYAAWGVAQSVPEVLVKATENWSGCEMPCWEGMRFSLETIKLDTYEPYVVMELLDKELEVPFACFCVDVIESLNGVEPQGRATILADVIYRWDQFFTHISDITLSKVRQRGLFAELFWLRRLLSTDMADLEVVQSWKGPLQKAHDFDTNGKVVEVKSTITKEPREVIISNERQLDDRNLEGLYLFVLTLDVHEAGESLPQLVDEISERLGEGSAAAKYKRKLMLSRYLNADAEKYTGKYLIRHEEIFCVREGFPRIYELPVGTGNVRYSVQIAACKPFQLDVDEYLGRCCG